MKRNSDQYLVYIPRLTLPKEFLNDNNDSKLTMLGGRLFQTLIIRSLKKCFRAFIRQLANRLIYSEALEYVIVFCC